VAWNHDGTRLATASGDGTACIWNPATGDTLTTLTGHTNQVQGVAWNHGGTRLATASADGTARIWNPATGECLAVVVLRDSAVGIDLHTTEKGHLRLAIAVGLGWNVLTWYPGLGELPTS
jgi:WD40 repeat protein